MVLPDVANVVLQGDAGTGIILLWLAVVVIVIAGFWKTFEKAGQPGWYSIIPIWNAYIALKIGGKEWWWLLVAFVPIIGGLVLGYVMSKGIADAFGQELGFTLGLMFLPFIFYPLLGFGDYQFQGTPQ